MRRFLNTLITLEYLPSEYLKTPSLLLHYRSSLFHPPASVESGTCLGDYLFGGSWQNNLPMAMMASASSGNPYENYDNTEIEQDLIDPDDGIFGC